ncbi:MAG: class I SAM-dependent methyltransferase [archaeon]
MESSDVRSQWAERTGEYSPRYYAYYGPDELSDAIVSVLQTHLPPSISALEVGCSSGRHLARLYREGYRDITGIEINAEALDVMEEQYPETAAVGTYYEDAVESVVETLDDREFDVVFSVQTLQHLHSDSEWVFDELRRIAEKLIVTVEIEGADRRDGAETLTREIDGLPMTHRNWRHVFERGDFSQVHSEDIGTSTLRAFRRADA